MYVVLQVGFSYLDQTMTTINLYFPAAYINGIPKIRHLLLDISYQTYTVGTSYLYAAVANLTVDGSNIGNALVVNTQGSYNSRKWPSNSLFMLTDATAVTSSSPPLVLYYFAIHNQVCATNLSHCYYL